MQSDKRRRLAFFGLALLAHAIVFYLFCGLTVFQAQPPSQDDAAFTRIAVPIHVAEPPPPPSASAPQLPSLVPPTTAPAPVAPIVTATPNNSFAMPKIDTAGAMNSFVVNLPSPTSSAGGSGSNGSGTLGAGGIATASTSEMEAFLHSDTREGAIIGAFMPCLNNFTDAAQMDAIRQRLVTSIGWHISRPDPGHGLPGIKYGMDIPLLVKCEDLFTRPWGDIEYLQFVSLAIGSDLRVIKTKTTVLVWDFYADYDPGEGPNTESDYCAKIVAQLRANHTRLCIISFKNAPFPPLLDYVKQSGGAVLYPKGIPAAENTANQLLQDSER